MKKKRFYPNSNFKNDTYYMKKSFKHQISKAIKAGKDIYINTVRKLNNLDQALEEKWRIKLMKINQFSWYDFKTKYINRLTRDGVIESVEKALECGSFDNGFLYFECPNCDNFHIQGFTCKSRFCPTCEKKYRDARSAAVSEKLLDVPHRQFVFSIPEQMRNLFREFRELLDVFFKVVEATLNETIFAKAPIASKKEHRQLGFISFLHTFGRDLKWHPHLHVLVAEAYSKSDGTLTHISYFPFESYALKIQI